jgi:aromatic ring hydroxylase
MTLKNIKNLQINEPMHMQSVQQYVEQSVQSIKEQLISKDPPLDVLINDYLPAGGGAGKYDEAKICKEIETYIMSTYNQHYVGKDGVQTIDVWQSMGMEKELCLGTALKYLMRFGKKEGYNEKDLFKAVHYIVLLIYFSRNKEST